MRRFAVLSLLAALCGGCASGELTLDMAVAIDAQSISYHVDPNGSLAVTSGGGIVQAGGKKLLEKKLSEKEMGKLKQAIMNSGFFTADSSLSGFGAGPSVSADISMGVWQNRVHGSPGDTPSLMKLCRQMNTYRPKPLQVLLDTAKSSAKEDLFAP